MTDSDNPACFGDLETVFPMGENGLRHTPDACFACPLKTECLRKAMAERGGLEVKEAMVDRAYRAGMMGFWERWSRKKTIHNAKTGLKENRR